MKSLRLLLFGALALAALGAFVGGARSAEPKSAAVTAGSSLEVRQVLAPANDAGRFTLITRYSFGALIEQTPNAGNGTTTGRFAIPAGRLLTVEEKAGANTKLSDYTSRLDCRIVSGPDMGQVFPTVNGTATKFIAKPGDGYSCTFTNTLRPGVTGSSAPRQSSGSSLEVRKVLAPANDPGRFTLITRYSFGALIEQTPNAGNGTTTGRFAIPAGRLLTVEEKAGANTKLSDYTSRLDCRIVSGPDMGQVFPTVNGTATKFIAKPGDGYSCTFTNTRNAS